MTKNLLLIGDEIINLDSVTRAKKRIDKSGVTSVTLFFSATDQEKQVSKRFIGAVADDIWYRLETNADDITQ